MGEEPPKFIMNLMAEKILTDIKCERQYYRLIALIGCLSLAVWVVIIIYALKGAWNFKHVEQCIENTSPGMIWSVLLIAIGAIEELNIKKNLYAKVKDRLQNEVNEDPEIEKKLRELVWREYTQPLVSSWKNLLK